MSNVKECLLQLFWDGEESGHKADHADVARQIKRNKNSFVKEELLTVQKLKGHFSRLATLKKTEKAAEESRGIRC